MNVSNSSHSRRPLAVPADGYAGQRFQAQITARIEGNVQIVAPVGTPKGETVDMMAALRASLEAVNSKPKAAKKPELVKVAAKATKSAKKAAMAS